MLVTSPRAVRPGDPGLATLLALPCYAVGQASAEAAHAAGFAHVRAPGEGGVHSLLGAIAADCAAPRHLLHLAGRDRTDAPAPPGLSLAVVETYAADIAPLTPEAAAALNEGAIDVTLLYSARTAAAFAAEADRLGIRATTAIAALSPAIATAAGGGWRALATALAPIEPLLFRAAGLTPPRA